MGKALLGKWDVSVQKLMMRGATAVSTKDDLGPLDYLREGDAEPKRRLPKALLYMIVVMFLLAAGIGLGVHIYNSHVYVPRTTHIYCVDSATGRPVHFDATVIKDAGLDDDANKSWSIGPDQGGESFRVARNIAVTVQIMSPGYGTEQIMLDKNSPDVETIKLTREAASQPQPLSPPSTSSSPR